jgi:hypothetical protein
MRRSLSVRIATLVLAIALAAPAVAAPRRDDSPIGPIDRVERGISQFVQRIIHIFDLAQLDPPK